MWWRKCILLTVTICLNTVSGDYRCGMTGRNISCIALTEHTLYNNMTVSLSSESSNQIEALTIINSTIPILGRGIFSNFKGLHNLHLSNTQTSVIEAGAFEELFSLRELTIANNYLYEFNSDAFPTNNALLTLDLSHNMINELANFNISMFPSLTVMNVSYNRLEYLPEHIIKKLEENNNFYLVTDNNPWNCSHPTLASLLTTILEEALCTNKTFDRTESDEKRENIARFLYDTENKNITMCPIRCSISCCFFWGIGAIWVGIIIGNMCKLKRLLFTKPIVYEDKNTQYDKLDLLPKMPGQPG